MERARILRWRLEQQIERIRQTESDLQSRATARIVRPLIELHLPQFMHALGASQLEHCTEIPHAKIQADRYSVIVPIIVRDHLTSKVFQLRPLIGTFVLAIHGTTLDFHLVCKAVRYRNRFVGDAKTGEWLAPGEYVEEHRLALVEVDLAVPELAVKQLFDQAMRLIPQILHWTNRAAKAQQRYRWYQVGRGVAFNLALLGYILALLFILIGSLLSMGSGFP
ncbi:hypothetical protein [Herpetosiphon llansteffanensis]|uniref:hypothetical protein n=1 Tax=Herpetosiphon llansteffanensis TaxID=2094568 RepID=UPI000D7CDAEB|nr:hypothetical protein [Herpetosiphon llansteffanensis]